MINIGKINMNKRLIDSLMEDLRNPVVLNTRCLVAYGECSDLLYTIATNLGFSTTSRIYDGITQTLSFTRNR